MDERDLSATSGVFKALPAIVGETVQSQARKAFHPLQRPPASRGPRILQLRRPQASHSCTLAQSSQESTKRETMRECKRHRAVKEIARALSSSQRGASGEEIFPEALMERDTTPRCMEMPSGDPQSPQPDSLTPTDTEEILPSRGSLAKTRRSEGRHCDPGQSDRWIHRSENPTLMKGPLNETNRSRPRKTDNGDREEQRSLFWVEKIRRQEMMNGLHRGSIGRPEQIPSRDSAISEDDEDHLTRNNDAG